MRLTCREPRPSARIPAEPSQRQAWGPSPVVAIPLAAVATKPQAQDWNPWSSRSPAIEAQLEKLMLPVSKAVGGPLRTVPTHVRNLNPGKTLLYAELIEYLGMLGAIF